MRPEWHPPFAVEGLHALDRDGGSLLFATCSITRLKVLRGEEPTATGGRAPLTFGQLPGSLACQLCIPAGVALRQVKL
ncbi:hypothetical protein CVM39_02750 [Pseudooceanicola antarcticus]|uniref:SMP-30/Gluconolaconase/LRE-like region-containing protein n=1 Tax=Pseudooceanicola antarcticus TaxID=1247613 RepID=A0ABX4MUN2_9RHOB|nr:hypothetical protein CVM39_02750 [Pseudooceanicola antarcticus]